VEVQEEKLNLGEVDEIFDQGAQMMAYKDTEHGFIDSGGGGKVDEGNVDADHVEPGEERHGASLLEGDGARVSLQGGDVEDTGGEETVEGGAVNNGHHEPCARKEM
jgi:hypothetical protein